MGGVDNDSMGLSAGIGVRADARLATAATTLLLHAAAIGAALAWVGSSVAPQASKQAGMPVFVLYRPEPARAEASGRPHARETKSAAVAHPGGQADALPPQAPSPAPAAGASLPLPQRPEAESAPLAALGGAAEIASDGPSDGEATRYTQDLWRHIATRRPHGVQGRGTTLITFRIGLDGALLAARIAGTSGDFNLDRIALRTLRQSAPFPRPPVTLSKGPLEFTVPVNFH